MRLLIRAPSWLGDAILALPAIVAARRHFGGASLVIAAPPAVAPLFAEDCGLDAAATLELPPRRSDQVRRLAGERVDLALLFTNSFGSAWVAWRAGIPERWGYRAGVRHLLLTRAVRRPRGRVHQAEYYRRLVDALGIRVPPAAVPRVSVRDSTRRRAAHLLAETGWTGERPLVGLAPGAAYGHAKRWPPAHAAGLVAALAASRGATVVLVGAAGDRDAGREIESEVGRTGGGARLVNVIGRTDLRTALGVLAACDVVVSNDSGAMHAAAALGRPVVAIFGPTDERVTGPVGDHDVIAHPVACRPCLLRECPIDHRCMTRIPASRVADAVLRRLDAHGPGDTAGPAGGTPEV